MNSMLIETFWELIEKSRTNTNDCILQAENLTQLLSNLEPAEIIAFDKHLNQKLIETYRWDLLAITCLVNAGATDDGFLYFRGWLIAQGKDYFEAALEKPENAAKSAVVDGINECENILFAARAAYQEKTDSEIPTAFMEPSQLTGESWEEDDLDQMFPEIAKKFSQEATDK